MAKLKPARCFHVQHKKSQVSYTVDRKEGKGKRQIQIPVVLGFNNVAHCYEMCDEGFVSTRMRLRTLSNSED